MRNYNDQRNEIQNIGITILRSLYLDVVIAHSEHQSFKNFEFRNFLW